MKHQFETFESWRIVGWCRFKELLSGLYGVLYVWLLWGVLSIFIFIGQQIEAFCRREPVAAFIVAVVIIFLAWGWISSSTSYKAELTTTQYLVDSLSYELSRYTIRP